MQHCFNCSFSGGFSNKFGKLLVVLLREVEEGRGRGVLGVRRDVHIHLAIQSISLIFFVVGF